MFLGMTEFAGFIYTYKYRKKIASFKYSYKYLIKYKSYNYEYNSANPKGARALGGLGRRCGLARDSRFCSAGDIIKKFILIRVNSYV